MVAGMLSDRHQRMKGFASVGKQAPHLMCSLALNHSLPVREKMYNYFFGEDEERGRPLTSSGPGKCLSCNLRVINLRIGEFLFIL